jgi:hypothetical protein
MRPQTAQTLAAPREQLNAAERALADTIARQAPAMASGDYALASRLRPLRVSQAGGADDLAAEIARRTAPQEA